MPAVRRSRPGPPTPGAGFYYGAMDAFLVVVLLVGYLWVDSFIVDEFESIKQNTVTAGGVSSASPALARGFRRMAGRANRASGVTVPMSRHQQE